MKVNNNVTIIVLLINASAQQGPLISLTPLGTTTQPRHRFGAPSDRLLCVLALNGLSQRLDVSLASMDDAVT